MFSLTVSSDVGSCQGASPMSQPSHLRKLHVHGGSEKPRSLHSRGERSLLPANSELECVGVRRKSHVSTTSFC